MSQVPRQSAWSEASMDESRANGAAEQQKSPLRGIGATQFEKQLTPQEVEALKRIKRKVDNSKTLGWILGGAGSFFLLNRRKPRPGNLPMAGLSFLGGLGGSFILMPFGIMMSRDVIKDVEDPVHLKRVLAGAVEERRRGQRPTVNVSPPNGLNGGQEWGGEAPAPSGNNGFSSGGAAFPSGSGAPPATRAPSSSLPQAFDDPNEQSAGNASQSRWTQLRRDRGVEPSKWDKIRQENAKSAYNRNNQSAEPPRQDAARSYPPSANSDPRWSSAPSQGAGRRPMEQTGGGWGDTEFVKDINENQSGPSSRGQQRYGILSVLEEKKPLTGFEVDSGAPIKVVKGSLLAALAGAISGSVYGVMKGQMGVGTVLASRMGFNFFAFGFPFFAIREYAANPALALIAHEQRFDHPIAQGTRIRPVSNPHTRDLASSGLSGAIVGGGLAGYARGKGSIASGIIMFGAACTGLQLLGNELRVARGKLLNNGTKAAPVAVPAAAEQAKEEGERVVQKVQDGASAVQEKAVEAKEKVQAKTSESKWLNSLKSLSPVRSIPDEEYEQKLKERLHGVKTRLAEIQDELQRLEAEEGVKASVA